MTRVSAIRIPVLGAEPPPLNNRESCPGHPGPCTPSVTQLHPRKALRRANHAAFAPSSDVLVWLRTS